MTWGPRRRWLSLKTRRPSSTARAVETTSFRESSSCNNKAKRPLPITIGKKLEERVAKLSGGVAVVKVGAATEIEMKEKKARVEDALHATRAAVEEGIVPGGGVALIRATEVLTDLKGANSDQDAGIAIARRAMEEPLRQIADNAGFEPSVILAQIRKHEGNYGFNAANDRLGDMVDMGVIDPTKVVRTALQNAASIAGLIITTEAMIAESPKNQRLSHPTHDAMGDFDL